MQMYPGARRVLSERAVRRQYNRFARLSGRKYAKECPDDAVSISTFTFTAKADPTSLLFT